MVNLLEKSYSCQKFDLVKIPCEHAMTVLRAKYGDGVGYGNSIFKYSSPIYKAETYILAYSKAISVVPPEAEWTVQDTKISPPPYDRKLRRKKVKCTKGVVVPKPNTPETLVFFSKIKNMTGRRIPLRPIRQVLPRHYDLLLIRNDLDWIFSVVGEDRAYLERELWRIARFLRAILERLVTVASLASFSSLASSLSSPATTVSSLASSFPCLMLLS
ncbi:hypothetical protein BC332_13798 [Capsicum chinense]|nr:hypothetical protein BC332_13798 [Capsicum chinense]